MLTTLEEHGAKKGHVKPELMNMIYESLLEPEVPGRALANLALRAPKELSGQYFHWDNEKVAALEKV